jgi:putative transposase
MTPHAKDTQTVSFRQDDFQQFVRDTMRDFVRIALTTILEKEVTAFIGAAPYEQNPIRRAHRNGSYTRDLDTSVGRIADLRVPRTRRGFRTQVFDRYQRRRREVDESIGEMFIHGVSTVGVGRVVEDLSGVKPSPNTVSRVFHRLDDEFAAWKQRKLESRYVYCFADGTYFSVIYDHQGCKDLA